MDNIAIRVNGLGKKYRIGGPREKYHSLRDTLINSIKSPLQKLCHKGNVLSDQDFWALKNVSFEVQKGEVIGIIGRNGAGKSTLLKILSRITAPTEGEVELYGRVGSLLEVGTGFHPELTGRENIFLSGSIIGMKKREIENKFDDIVKFSEIDRFIDTPVKRYSSGMYVRLAFAVAAHLDPEILVIDEVLAVGDAAFQKKCLGKMSDVAREGRTVLFVSHNLSSVKQLCNRGILLNNGQIIIDGPSNETIKSYLHSNAANSSQVFFPKDPNKAAQFTYVSISDLKDNYLSDFSCDESIKIVTIFELKEKKRGIYFGITIQTYDGIKVLYSDIRDDGLNIQNIVDSGVNMISLIIPPRLLGPGTYLLKIDAALPQYGMIDSTDFVCSFCIRDFLTIRGDNRIGYFSAILPWNVKPNTLS